MRVSILQKGDYLIVSLQSSLNDGEFRQLRNRLIALASQISTKGMIIDVGKLDVMDSFATRILGDIADVSQHRGAPTVLVGIQPHIKFSIAQLGLDIEKFEIALNLEEGLALLKND